MLNDCRNIRTCSEVVIYKRHFDIWHPQSVVFLKLGVHCNGVFKTMCAGSPSHTFSLKGPACPASAFSIVLTDGEPGTGYNICEFNNFIKICNNFSDLVNSSTMISQKNIMIWNTVLDFKNTFLDFLNILGLSLIGTRSHNLTGVTEILRYYCNWNVFKCTLREEKGEDGLDKNGMFCCCCWLLTWRNSVTTLPYDHPVNTVTSNAVTPLTRPPRLHGHPVNTATPLLQPPC